MSSGPAVDVQRTKCRWSPCTRHGWFDRISRMWSRHQERPEFSQTRFWCGDVRTMKTEIIDHAKLMPTTHPTHTSIEAPIARGCDPSASTIPGRAGVDWEYGTGNRRCVTLDRGLDLEQLYPNGIDPPGSGAAGGGPIHRSRVRIRSRQIWKGRAGPGPRLSGAQSNCIRQMSVVGGIGDNQ